MTKDNELTDVDLQAEIDLVGALVLAAAQADGPLSQEAIDDVLGVRRGGAPSAADGPVGPTR